MSVIESTFCWVQFLNKPSPELKFCIKRDNSDEHQRALAIEGEQTCLIINMLHQLLIRVSLVRAQVEEPI